MTAIAPTLQIGSQRDWIWRGWRVRYTHTRPALAADGLDTPVLMLHGFGASLGQWHRNLEALGASRSVYALDLLGFGASEKAAVTYGTNLWMAQVYDFWRTWIQRPVFLMGHSLGALVALKLAVTYPEMVRGLVLITLPAARQELLPNWVNQVAMRVEQLFASPLVLRPLFWTLRRPATIRRVLGAVYHRAESITDELVELFSRPPQDQGAARAFCYLVRSRTEADFSPLTQELIRSLQVPTLMLWGEADRVIPAAWGKQIAPLSPQVQFRVIEDAGHCLYDEEPDQVNQLVLEWISQQESPSDSPSELSA